MHAKNREKQLVQILLIQADLFIPTDRQIWNVKNWVHLKLYWEDDIMLYSSMFD